ncbi:polysaccharide deacetylase family protein [Geomicrobium sp. JCM 19038]|uniref:polysaccharide deacetylase family protein n=1 Tax=Geomicrobium sp. JCM 19038 TaxID=1460635 RepID=UPI00045F232A|nr:polysaccharide deacetylase family protein [Geomicrobium sp. JCM 19038]GAK08435.1 hypothetical protein JCM19038_2218 [Geomicrobium sp. JCM 19038]
MRKKLSHQISNVLTVISLCLLTMFFFYEESKAVENLLHHSEDRQVVVFYSSATGEIDEHQRLLDMALHSFTNDVLWVPIEHAKREHFQNKTHLVYYGQTITSIPPEMNQWVQEFDGEVLAIGYNVHPFSEVFNFIEVGFPQTITELFVNEDYESRHETYPVPVLNVSVGRNQTVDIHSSGGDGSRHFPMYVQKDQYHYFASPRIDKPFSIYFSNVLVEFFNHDYRDNHYGYLRLEDIHPLVNPEHLMAIAEELKHLEIPYMMAVIPVYTHPETGRQYHFSDSPEVLEALLYMQDHGGSVVLHGYTHQFRQSETGEGFEFWDVENEMPIYHDADTEDPVLYEEEDFINPSDYDDYVEQNHTFEREYIESRITRGVQELVNFGLYPLAFEAPHYTMSQHGYEVLSDYFSTYVGQLQLSDEKWEIMDTTPLPTTPDFLHGMTLLPETIGYVQPDAEQPVQNVMNEVEFYQSVDSSLIGGFYHPYIELKYFDDFSDELLKREDITWIDLKDYQNHVEVEHVTIQSGEGEIEVEIDRTKLLTTSIEFPAYHLRNLAQSYAWVIAGISGGTVFVFIGLIFFQVIRRKIREED